MTSVMIMMGNPLARSLNKALRIRKMNLRKTYQLMAWVMVLNMLLTLWNGMRDMHRNS